MSAKKGRFAPGGREYERKKQLNKRRGAPRKPLDPENKKPEGEEEVESGEEGEEKQKSGSSSEDEGKEEIAKTTEPASTKEEKKGSSGEEEEDSGSSGEEGGDESWRSNRKKEAKAKGVAAIIDIENPNRAKKEHMKVSDLKNLKISEPTRKEKEALEKQKMQKRAENRDLERLAEVRKQRDEAAKRREEEIKSKETKRVQDAKSQGKVVAPKPAEK